mmetsp:Transcript_14998/g.35743  ORF Transcript_14998/g.35743 Transcript_14998/m.35743 type:complete len:103 (-) Transcript_14998:3-311(-)
MRDIDRLGAVEFCREGLALDLEAARLKPSGPGADPSISRRAPPPPREAPGLSCEVPPFRASARRDGGACACARPPLVLAAASCWMAPLRVGWGGQQERPTRQ